MSTRWLTVAVILLALGVAAWIGSDYLANRVQSREFSGLVEKVDGNLLTVRGFYMVNGNPVSQSGKGEEATVQIASYTRFVLTTLKLPEFSPSSTASRVYDPNTLPRTTVSGSLQDIRTGLAVHISTRDNIFQKTQFEASEISYTDFTSVKKSDPAQPSS